LRRDKPLRAVNQTWVDLVGVNPGGISAAALPAEGICDVFYICGARIRVVSGDEVGGGSLGTGGAGGVLLGVNGIDGSTS
jgi:hypothetical protein